MERSASGWINGFIGVVIFAGSLPATRLAVLQLDAGFVTAARATIAAVLGLGRCFCCASHGRGAATCQGWWWSASALWSASRC